MSSVYVTNIVINAGANFSQSFTLESADYNSALDLTNYSISSQLRKWSGSTSYISFSTSILDPPTSGKILIYLTPAQTANLKPGRYVYDILITSPTGLKSRVIEGMALVREGVTR
jgi:hypothetical protein